MNVFSIATRHACYNSNTTNFTTDITKHLKSE